MAWYCCICINNFAFGSVNASVIVLFAQVLNAPETALKYLNKIGFSTDLSPGRVVFYIAIIVLASRQWFIT